MQMTAVVINAGLGEMSLGLKMAGFEVLAAFENDKKALEIHKANLDIPGFPLVWENMTTWNVPDVDLLAGKLYDPLPPDYRGHALSTERSGATVDDFLKILELYYPKAFLLALGAGFARSRHMEPFLSRIRDKNFKCWYQVIDIAKAVGAPTAECMPCVVGTRADAPAAFEFPPYSFSAHMPLDAFLQPEEQIDEWYFSSVKPRRIPANRTGEPAYCWKTDSYVGTNVIRWNHWMLPLVDTGQGFRKITHREIANLKGFPYSYKLSIGANKSWLYNKLMYATNVSVITAVAERIANSLTAPSRLGVKAMGAIQFEVLFSRYLEKLADKKGARKTDPGMNARYDFMLQLADRTSHFELKYYGERNISAPRIKRLCQQLLPLPENGELILVLTSEVPEDTKLECQKQYRVAIWDVKNLLWLFGEFEDIKNEFIALLDYAAVDIEPVPVEFGVFAKEPEAPDLGLTPDTEPPENASEHPKEIADWKERFEQIKPGREQFREYESLCIDILKYTLGDYLSLWEEQNPTDDGLHHFDLCCKIKNDVSHDFFDTVKQYFNTKYIVFEFKNYGKKITQREIYTTEKYLFGTALRKVAIIISRQGNDDHALQAAKGSLRESGKLILCLSDADLLEMAAIKLQGSDEPAVFLSNMLDRLLVHLEK